MYALYTTSEGYNTYALAVNDRWTFTDFNIYDLKEAAAELKQPGEGWSIDDPDLVTKICEFRDLEEFAIKYPEYLI